MVEYTIPQMRALALVARRDYPAGEPRLSWIHKKVAEVLFERKCIIKKSDEKNPIIELTTYGKAVLANLEEK